MRLAAHFYKLPLHFEVERLVEEVRQFCETDWIGHPTEFGGNTAIPLVSVGGGINHDLAMAGQMQPTPMLERCPYVEQVMASFQAPISRARLMRVEGTSSVPPHDDIRYHWFRRTRIHVPIVTNPGVTFHCEEHAVHMRAGEAWIFDNFRRHMVRNAGDAARIHLVVDTKGSPAFWGLVSRAERPCDPGGQGDQPEYRLVRYRPGETQTLQIEPYVFEVLTGDEMDRFVRDIVKEARGVLDRESMRRLEADLELFRRRWQGAFATHGHDRSGKDVYADLIRTFADVVAPFELAARLARQGDGHAAVRIVRTMLAASNERRGPIGVAAADASIRGSGAGNRTEVEPHPMTCGVPRGYRCTHPLGEEIDMPAKDNDRNGVSRRRFLRVAGVTAAGALGLARGGGDAGAARRTASPPRFRPRGTLRRRPNFLVILVDEMRYPVVYESDELKTFRAQYLVTQQRLKANGLEFTNHYAMATACTPSRVSLFTGHYPSLHGASQTSGAAKSEIEEDMFWLDANTVPTMGEYFRAGGYRTFYKGKWHLSAADIFVPGTHSGLPSYDQNGTPVPQAEDAYLQANRLDDFGFTGWIGPEPHGQNPLNSGSSAGQGKTGRDVHFAQQAADRIRDQSAHKKKPWLIVVSLVNPHDIALWGYLSLLGQQYNLLGQLDGTVPKDLFVPSMFQQTNTEDLGTKPTAQQSYRDSYSQFMQPANPGPFYREFYYQLHKTVDGDMTTVLDALAEDSREYRDTIVIWTSDHGDLLGAHGGMFQKWYTAYEESIHVPFIVHNPKLFTSPQSVDVLTSHADLLPTMLGLAGLNTEKLRQKLAETHDEAHPLVGRDLSGLILGEVQPDTINDPIYFMTDDDPSRGDNQNNWIGIQYASVEQPNHLETVIANLPTGENGALQKWKYTKYFDNPQFWSSPGTQDVVTIEQGPPNQPGDHVCATTVKTAPLPDQLELYNVTADPMELDNLGNSQDPGIVDIRNQLDALLQQQCAAKRLVPQSGTVPGQPACGDI